MRNKTYASYVNDPAVREQVEREVRRLRHEAIDIYIVAPLKRMFKRAPATPAPVRERPALNVHA